MTDKQIAFFQLPDLPARLDAEDTATFLGFSDKEISILIGCGHLIPLGKPAQNAQKYFLLHELRLLRSNREWFGQAGLAIKAYWKRKDELKKLRRRKRRPERRPSI